MATLDERIGLSFDEDEEKQRAGTLPAVAPEAASPAADGGATLIDQPLAESAPAPAPPVEPAEPKKLSPAADTPEGFDMPVVTKVEGRGRIPWMTVREGATRPKPRHPSDLLYEHTQRVKAEMELRNATEQAERRKHEAWDASELAEAQKFARMLNVDVEVALPNLKVVRDYVNDREYKKLDFVERSVLPLERGYLSMVTGVNALDMMMTSYHLDQYQKLKAKAEGNIPLTVSEGLALKNLEKSKHLLEAGRLENLSNIMAAQQKLNAKPVRPSMREFEQAKGRKAFEVFFDQPWGIMADVTVESIPTLAAGAVATALTGPAGGLAVGGAATFGKEFFTKLVDNIEDDEGRKIDLKDPQALRAALQNREWMARAFNKTAVKAGIATVTEALGGKAARAVDLPFDGPVVKKAADFFGRVGAQGTAAAGGEITGSLLVGDKIEPNDVIKAFLGGAAGEVFDTTKAVMGAGIKSGIQTGKTAVNAMTPPQPSLTRRIADQFSDMETARQRTSKLADEMRDMRKLDPLMQKHRIDRIDPEERVFVPFDDVERWRKNNVIDNDFWVQSGIHDQYAESKRTGGDFVILKSQLLTAKIAPEHIDDVARSTRARPTDMTGHESIDKEQKWAKSLAAVADGFEKHEGPALDGHLIYRRTYEHLTQKGVAPEIAREHSAFTALHYRIKAQEGAADGLTADQRFLRDLHEDMTTPSPTGAVPAAAAKDKPPTDMRVLPEAEGGDTDEQGNRQRPLVIEITKPNRVPMEKLFD